MKKVSIIIPCYNDKDFVEAAVASALALVYEKKEIIIVDDGSNKETKSILQTLQGNQVQLITQENKGLSGARNTGINAATGEYILTHDADDIFETSFLEKAVPILEDNPKIGMVSCWVNSFVEFGSVTSGYKPNGGTVDDFAFSNNACGNLLFRKECWVNVGGYDEQMKKGYEDWEFNLSVTMKGWVCHIIPEYLFNYRNKPGSMLKDTNANYMEQNFKYVFMKHQTFYKDRFEGTIDRLIGIALEYKKNEKKRLETIDYRLGNFLLKPYRWIKSLF